MVLGGYLVVGYLDPEGKALLLLYLLGVAWGFWSLL